MGMCLLGTALLLADLSSLPSLLGVIFLVALGLGAVIFVHELGHFLVAKACGVKCEKFMIGFDIGGYKLSRKWGETEYGIGILPLGGYVKMLGQDDDPAHIAEQLKKSEVAETSPDAVEVRGPNGETYHVDRRSYLAKSVPQRMAIISAGVVMNVIFAFMFAVIAYGLGVKYMPSIVSETMPGSPAWRAGLEPGDEIVKIGDRANPTFMQLKGGVTLGDMENGIPIVVRRAANGEEVELRLKPEQNQGRGLATIGILNARTLKLFSQMPVAPKSSAANAKQIAPPLATDAKSEGLKAGDEIIRVGDADVKDFRAFVVRTRDVAAGANSGHGAAYERSVCRRSGRRCRLRRRIDVRDPGPPAAGVGPGNDDGAGGRDPAEQPGGCGWLEGRRRDHFDRWAVAQRGQEF